MPTDLDGPAELPAGGPFASLWYSEWRYQAPGLGATGLQWMNFSASGAMRVTYLGGDPRPVPPGGSVAVDVAASAAFFSSEAEPVVSVLNAQRRGSPPTNFALLDFSALGVGAVSDLTFARGASGCRFPYEAFLSGPAPLRCQPFPGCDPPPPAPSGAPPAPPRSNAVGTTLLLLGAGAVLLGSAAWWWRRQRRRRRQQQQAQAPEGSGEQEDVKDTAGLVVN